MPAPLLRTNARESSYLLARVLPQGKTTPESLNVPTSAFTGFWNDCSHSMTRELERF
jgi:hypothetical protein